MEIDLTNKIFGRLKVIKKEKEFNKERGSSTWLCECQNDGNIIEVNGKSLRSGNTRSCGCLAQEVKILNGKLNKKYNEYFKIDNQTMGGYAHNTNDIFYFDDEYFDIIKEYCWGVDVQHGGKYVVAKDSETKKKILLHRLILDFPEMMIDHVDRNPLNNRINNLRLATNGQNTRNAKTRKDNQTGVRGVSYNQINKNWRAILDYNDERVLDKSFSNFDEAVKERLLAEKKYYKEFAPQTNLFEKYGIK